MKQSLGIIEVKGLVYTIACVDAALKSADIELIGCESSRGGARFVSKFTGNIGSVQAGVDAARALAKKEGQDIVGYVIPRPSEDCRQMVLKENRKQRETKETAETPETDEETSEVPEKKEPEVPDEKEPEVLEEKTPEVPEETDPEISEPAATCNLCGDPACPRHKNEPHGLCIHFKSDRK